LVIGWQSDIEVVGLDESMMGDAKFAIKDIAFFN
jgi:hypothetical protein